MTNTTGMISIGSASGMVRIRPQTTNTLAVGAAKVKLTPDATIRRKEVHIRKLAELRSLVHDRYDAAVNATKYYRSLFTEEAVAVFGDYNPLYNRRPKAFVLKLLQLAAGPMPRSAVQFEYMLCGLYYLIPHVFGIRKGSVRLTPAGLGLLDHWSEKFPKFKPFVDAYATKAARKEITIDCADLALGHIPHRYAEIEARNEVLLKEFKVKEYDRLTKEMEEVKKALDYERERNRVLGSYQPITPTTYRGALLPLAGHIVGYSPPTYSPSQGSIFMDGKYDDDINFHDNRTTNPNDHLYGMLMKKQRELSEALADVAVDLETLEDVGTVDDNGKHF